MDLTDPRITAARARAALGYQGINLKADGQKRTGISYPTLSRIVAKTNPRRASTDEMRQIAAACPDVPDWFFEHGFAPPVETGEQDLREALAALSEDLLRQLELSEARLRAELREAAAGNPPSPDVTGRL